MWFTPSSTARRSTAMPSSGSRGGPPKVPVGSRIAPKPSRLTGRSPPRGQRRRRADLRHAVMVSVGAAPSRGERAGSMLPRLDWTTGGDEQVISRTRGRGAGRACRSSVRRRAARVPVCRPDLDTWSQPEARAAIGRRMRATDLGFTVRKLLSPVALADEDERAHLRLVQSAGALVRISGSRLPHETIIIDRRVMILAGQETPDRPRVHRDDVADPDRRRLLAVRGDLGHRRRPRHLPARRHPATSTPTAA